MFCFGLTSGTKVDGLERQTKAIESLAVACMATEISVKHAVFG